MTAVADRRCDVARAVVEVTGAGADVDHDIIRWRNAAPSPAGKPSSWIFAIFVGSLAMAEVTAIALIAIDMVKRNGRMRAWKLGMGAVP